MGSSCFSAAAPSVVSNLGRANFTRIGSREHPEPTSLGSTPSRPLLSPVGSPVFRAGYHRRSDQPNSPARLCESTKDLPDRKAMRSRQIPPNAPTCLARTAWETPPSLQLTLLLTSGLSELCCSEQNCACPSQCVVQARLPSDPACSLPSKTCHTVPRSRCLACYSDQGCATDSSLVSNKSLLGYHCNERPLANATSLKALRV